MTFLYPKVLYLLLLIPALLLWYLLRGRKQHASLRIPSVAFLGKERGWRTHLIHLPFILRNLALVALIIALACPQSHGAWSESSAEGIDIVMAMDVSSSMLAEDFDPNRLEAAKKEAADFINTRENDNIGLVVFSGESFTYSPLTTDHAQVLNRLYTLEPGMIEDGTAIGLGLVTAINRLRGSKAKSKVIILLTDGRNNTGDISPQTAADLAAALDINVHCIGMGTLAGKAPVPVASPFGVVRTQMADVDVDEPTLKTIAHKTGGLYYRATDNDALNHIYKEIDKLEKTKLKNKNYQVIGEDFSLFALIAALCILLEFILRNTLLRTNP